MKTKLFTLTLGLLVTAGLFAQTTIYIDPDYTGGASDGSMENPYVSWLQVNPLEAGNTYLQKRGTVCQTDAWIALADGVTVGAYGEGTRPIIRNTIELVGNGAMFYALNREGEPNTTTWRNITVKDFIIEGNSVSACLLFEGDVEDVTVENCELIKGVWGIRILCWGGSEDLEAKLNERYIRILNNRIHGCGEDGIVVGYTWQGLEIGYNTIYDINRKYFGEFGGNGNSQYDAPGDPVQIFDSYCQPWIHHNFLDKSSTEYKFALILATNTDQEEPSKALIEYNILIGQGRNTAAAFYLDGGHDAIVRGNVMSNAPQAIYQKSTTGSLVCYNNIFYDVNFALLNEGSSGAEFYNNTMVDCGGVLQADFTDPLIMKNNILYTPTDTTVDWMIRFNGASKPDSSKFASDYNLVYPEHPTMWLFAGNSYNTLADWQAEGYGASSVIGDPLFNNPDMAVQDLRLGEGSPASDAGVAIEGITADGNANPDIGADMDLLWQMPIGANFSHYLIGIKPLEIPSEYGPYQVMEARYIDTGDWMGLFDSIRTNPYLWKSNLGSWWYLTEDQVSSEEGAWVYILP